MRLLFSGILIMVCGLTFSQTDLKKLLPDSNTYTNIYVTPLQSDSLSSSFAIWIKSKVKLHKHAHHTEQVYVINGKGNMTVGDSVVEIKKGDLITVPKNTWHGVEVTSKRPLKVISVQSPMFTGKDRIFKKP